jgi:hypothetical protein
VQLQFQLKLLGIGSSWTVWWLSCAAGTRTFCTLIRFTTITYRKKTAWLLSLASLQKLAAFYDTFLRTSGQVFSERVLLAAKMSGLR